MQLQNLQYTSWDGSAWDPAYTVPESINSLYLRMAITFVMGM